MTGIERIAAERMRQIEEEEFTAELDDLWEGNELIDAALCYAMDERKRDFLLPLGINPSVRVFLWPWNEASWKPTPDNRIRELEKAGALIAAEIDRLLRAQGAGGMKMDCMDCKQSLVTEDDRLICVEKLKAGKTEEESIVDDDGYCEEYN